MAEDVGALLKRAVSEVLDEARRVPSPQNSHQTVTVLHGDPPKPQPWPAVICACSCVVMGILSLVLGFAYLEVREDQRDTAAHLATIYVLVPELRERVQEHLKEKE